MKSPLIGGSRGDGSVYSRRGSRHTNRASAFFDITEHSSDKGSTMFAAVVALSNTCMGTGILALPAAYAKAGLFGGIGLGVVGAALAAMSIYMLEAAATRAGVDKATLFTLCEAVLPGSGSAISIALLICTLGGALTYVIVAADNITSTYPINRKIFMVASACYFVPLCFLRSMDSLRVVSLVSVCCLLLSALTVLAFFVAPEVLDPCGGGGDGKGFEEPVLVAEGAPSTALCHSASIKTVGEPMALFNMLPTFMLAYFCQHNTFTVLSELENPTPARKAAAVGIALCVVIATYTVVASAGYLTFGDLVASNVLNSYPADSTAVAVTRTALAVAVLGSIPLQLSLVYASHCSFPGDMSGASKSLALSEAEPLDDDVFISAPLDLAVTTAFTVTLIVLGLLVTDLGTVVGALGATAGTLIFLIVPGVCFVLAARSCTPTSTIAGGAAALGVLVIVNFMAGQLGLGWTP